MCRCLQPWPKWKSPALWESFSISLMSNLSWCWPKSSLWISSSSVYSFWNESYCQGAVQICFIDHPNLDYDLQVRLESSVVDKDAIFNAHNIQQPGCWNCSWAPWNWHKTEGGPKRSDCKLYGETSDQKDFELISGSRLLGPTSHAWLPDGRPRKTFAASA